MLHPIAEANEQSLFGSLTPSEFYTRHSVSHSSEYITNSRGLNLFTQWWIPLPPTKIIGTIAIVHGFKDETSWFVQLTAVHLSKSGFATCAIDHQGHGFSHGLRAHIPDINAVIDDCIAFFDSFRAVHAPSLPSFLYAESLGGAIALLITLQRGEGASRKPWDGVVLSGAMCGVSAKFKPPWPLEYLLPIVAAVIPTWRVIPTRGTFPDIYIKEEWKQVLGLSNPRLITERPRAATAREFLRVCTELQGRFEEVNTPIFIVHGGDDAVCDPSCVEELYQRAASKDKTLKIYPGMRHVIAGEPQENVELVFGDIVKWLRTRAELAAVSNGGA